MNDIPHNTAWPAYSFWGLLDRLPLEARRKYRAIVAMKQDVEAVLRNNMERGKEMESMLAGVDTRLVRCDPKTDAHSIAKLKKERESLRMELDALEQIRAVKNTVRSNLDQTISQLRDIAIPRLVGERSPPLCAHSVSAHPQPNETLKDAINRVRRAIRVKQIEYANLKAAPLPPADIRAAIVKQVDQLADRGRPALNLDAGKVEISWPDMPLFANTGQAIGAPSGSATRLLCWLFHDDIVAALTNGIDQVQGGVSTDTRQCRIAELEREILEFEYEEESLVEQALADGMECHRRFECNPLAVLGIAFDEPTAATTTTDAKEALTT
jgi:hypothetical protein